MKIFTNDELQSRKELLNSITFDVSNSTGESDVDEQLMSDYPDTKFFVMFYDETGCVYDGGDIVYLFQNDFPDGLYEPFEGTFTYEGDLTKDQMRSILKKIGFED